MMRTGRLGKSDCACAAGADAAMTPARARRTSRIRIIELPIKPFRSARERIGVLIVRRRAAEGGDLAFADGERPPVRAFAHHSFMRLDVRPWHARRGSERGTSGTHRFRRL